MRIGCIVKLPDKVCASHTKHVGDNKTILQPKKFAEVLLAGSLQPLDNQCGKAARCKRMEQSANIRTCSRLDNFIA